MIGAGNGSALPLAMWPPAPPALIDAARLRRSSIASAPSAEMLGELERAARAAPLRAEPYYAFGLAAIRHGEPNRGTRLLEAARRRDPRLLGVHLALFDRYAHAGQLDRALVELGTAASLAPNDAERMIGALSPLAGIQEARPLLIKALARYPSWRMLFIRRAGSGAGDLNTLFEAIARAPMPMALPDGATEQEVLLDALVSRGEYERAYLAWLNLLPADQLGHVAAIYDGDFRGLHGPRPFNWQLGGDESASADLDFDRDLIPRSALSVQYSGARPTAIASQLLLLRPGRYRLHGIASGSSESSFSGRLEWQLTCAGGGRPIGSVVVAPLRTEGASFAGVLTVPAVDCTAQRLALVGVAGEVSSLISARVGGLAIEPL